MNADAVALVVLAAALIALVVVMVAIIWRESSRGRSDAQLRREELWQRDRQLQQVTQDAMRHMLAELRQPRRRY